MFLIELLVLVFVIYVAGLIVVGKKPAMFSRAFTISLFGIIASTLFIVFLPSLIALILSMLVWLLLIKSLYKTGGLGAMAIGILAIMIYLVVLILLAFVFGVLGIIIRWLLSVFL